MKVTWRTNMPLIENSIEIDAAAEQVWHFLGDLLRAPDYIPGIVSARLEGSRRICFDQDTNEIQEEISNDSDKAQHFNFEHVKSPLPVKSSRGHFSVSSHGQRSSVAMTWELEFLDAAMESQLLPMIEGAARTTLENIKQKTENH
jgi:hypothetical protein